MRGQSMNNSSFGFDKPEDSPGFLLWQTSMTWQRLIKNALDCYGVSHAQFVILAVLLWCDESGQSPIQSFLVNKTKLDKMTVSASLKKLVLNKLVKRGEHTQDTRAKLVCLTYKGKMLTKKLVLIVEGIDQDFFGVISKTNHRSLVANLNQLVGNRVV
jgi:MarR family transcriptional regulator, organic hydroperoxide resistance regulator